MKIREKKSDCHELVARAPRKPKYLRADDEQVLATDESGETLPHHLPPYALSRFRLATPPPRHQCREGQRNGAGHDAGKPEGPSFAPAYSSAFPDSRGSAFNPTLRMISPAVAALLA